MNPTLTWLHLSDLHACKPKSGWDATRILRTLLTDLEKMQGQRGLRPDFIFFTGDAAFGNLGDAVGFSIASQFNRAESLFDKVRKAFRPAVRRKDFFIVPGNHDVNRKAVLEAHMEWLDNPRRTPIELNDLIKEAGPQWQDFMKRLAGYTQFLEQAKYGHLLTKGNRDRLVYAVTRKVASRTIGIAGMNTAWSCCRESEKGKLRFGGDWQLEWLREELLRKKAELHIALMHHPVNWFDEWEDPKIGRKIEGNFHFSLHGHEHQGWVTPVGDSHLRIAAGACYDRSDKPNGYNLVRLGLETGDVEVWLREYDPDAGAWKARVLPGHTDGAYGVWRRKLCLPWSLTASPGHPPASGVATADTATPDTATPVTATPVTATPVTVLDPDPGAAPPGGEAAGGDPTRQDFLPVHCTHHTTYADIEFPGGDLVVREIIEGLQWKGAAATSALTLLSFASRILPEGEVHLRSLTHPYIVRVNPQERVQIGDTQEGPISAHRVHFEPALKPGHAPITLECDRSWRGVMYSSVYDKQRHDVSQERSGWDQYLKRIRWGCDRATIHIRLWPAEWQPLNVRTLALDDKGEECRGEVSELGPGAAIWGSAGHKPNVPYYWPSAEATLVVHQPQLGYCYGLRWELPPADAIPPPPHVQGLRKRLLRLANHPTASAAIACFLGDAVLSAKGLVEALNLDSPVNVGRIHGYVYSYDPTTAQLVCQASTAPANDYLRNHAIRWGQDIIGTACRLRLPFFYSAEGGGIRNFPASSDEFLHRTRTVLAFPITHGEQWVVAVAAVASCRREGDPAPGEPGPGEPGPGEPDPLARFVANPLVAARWGGDIAELWHAHCNNL